MYFLIWYLRRTNPVFSLLFQKEIKEVAYPWIWEYSVHQYIIVFIFILSLYFFEVFHRCLPVSVIFVCRIIHMVQKSFTEVFRYIFCVSLCESIPLSNNLMKYTELFAFGLSSTLLPRDRVIRLSTLIRICMNWSFQRWMWKNGSSLGMKII